MKFLISIFFIILILIVTSRASAPEDVELQMFTHFMAKYQKQYDSWEEQQQRYKIFKENLKRAVLLNQQNPTAVFSVTKFSDLTPEEFRSRYLMNITASDFPSDTMHRLVLAEGPMVPFTTWDWSINRTGIITPVKNQEECGSCWAFSATETIESYWALAGKGLQILSPQQIVDCDSVDEGCGGGWPYSAYEYVIQAGGLMTETSYPYRGFNGHCAFDQTQVVASIRSCYVTTDPAAENSTLLPYVAFHGPVSICVDASNWQLYSHGVLKTCSKEINHCVQLTGFQSMQTPTGVLPVWNVRNSWGADWYSWKLSS